MNPARLVPACVSALPDRQQKTPLRLRGLGGRQQFIFCQTPLAMDACHVHRAVAPPSTGSATPTTKDDASEHNQMTTSAISSG